MKRFREWLSKVLVWLRLKPEPNQAASDIDAKWQWVWAKGDVENWPVTINLSAVRLVCKAGSIHQVFVTYDRLQAIPAYSVPGDPANVHRVNGSIWMIREYPAGSCAWYIGTIDYLRQGQMEKVFDAIGQWMVEPVPGAKVGFMVSTMSRTYNGTIVQGDPESPYRERSNIVWTTWP